MKTAEKISLKVNPPKPERESNRRRKKKILDEDFIDITDPASMVLYDWGGGVGGGRRGGQQRREAGQSSQGSEQDGYSS